MKPYSELTKEELLALKAELDAAFEDVKGKGMKLDMSRGKPATVQLDMAEGLLSAVSSNEEVYTENGTDCRNYGLLTGIPEAKKLFADICEVEPSQVIVSGGGSNSPLFMQIFADVFGIRSVRNVINNAAGLGAAINAAVGVGEYPDYETAIDNMVRIRDGFEPNLEHTKVYDDIINNIYRNIKDYSDPINQKIYDMFG